MKEGVPNKIALMYVGKDQDIVKALRENNLGRFKVLHYENDLEAIDHMRKGKGKDIHAVIAEVVLPGVGGYELGTHLKVRLGLWKTPFILIGSDKDILLRKKALKNKNVFDDFYFYPFDVNNLFIRIEFLIKYLNRTEINEKRKADKHIYRMPVLKRLLDILVSFFVILVLSPLFLVVAIAIKLESKGPVIYKSKRVGTGYRIFDFYKFRSMYIGADLKLDELSYLNQYNTDRQGGNKSLSQIQKEVGSCPRCAILPEGKYCSPVLYIGGETICEHWYKILKQRGTVPTFVKIENDPRVTKVGKFIRNTSIDELPQLFNVLGGSMSIVGNRPLPLYEAELLTSDDWGPRFMAPAGITGLWQVKLRGKGGVMSEEERKALDNKYAETYSFFGDIKLILSTIPALFQKQNV